MAMEMMMMMIPMKSSLMTVTMASISPLRGGISPTDCSLPQSFSLSRVSAPWRRRNFSWTMYYVLGLQGVEVHEWGLAPVDQGHHTTCSRAGRWIRATRWCRPHRPHLGPLFWLPQSSGIIGTSRSCSSEKGLRKYGVLTTLFPADSGLR